MNFTGNIPDEPDDGAVRRPWIVPRVERMRAGDAENGIDNIVEDGMTTYGDS